MRANFNPKSFKKDIIEEQGNVCAICGMNEEWNGEKLVFILDHIDGNAANNRRDNLRCICPNCDSQLPTYKSKNKHSSRNYYRYHLNESSYKPPLTKNDKLEKVKELYDENLTIYENIQKLKDNGISFSESTFLKYLRMLRKTIK